LLLSACQSAPQPDSVIRLADELSVAIAAGQLLPRVSGQESVDLVMAYQIQKQLVARQQHFITGFKAGLTNAAGQRQFGAREAVSGVLFEQMIAQTLHLPDYNKMMLEVEVGYIASRTISEPVVDIAQLKGYFTSVLPVVEVPDLGFLDGPPRVEDIVAANLPARRMVLGKPVSTASLDLDLKVSLSRDQQSVLITNTSVIEPDQWRILLWLVNQVISQGYDIKPGYVLITGALAPMTPAYQGNYSADFGVLGKVSFKVVDVPRE